ncbi:MAG: class I SAM-dependent methyltransferase [Bacteroidales bacterium]|nr:class I SAM-dependent methyltransferase [Bacteroidales bacterium]
MEKQMSDLEKYFKNNDKRLIQKWNHYFDIYDRHFNRFRGKESVILEIGVFHGGSLQMWKDYFGKKARIYGIDLNPKCKKLEEENIEIFIGSQSDRKFLRKIKELIPPIDILIDDGGHTMTQQIVSYEELFSHIKSDGVYLCEDLHTSYRVKYGGGYKRMNTYIEYSKNFIDYLNAFHSEQRNLKVNSFTKTVDSIHYYDSVIVIEKRLKEEPFQLKTGHPSFQDEISDTNFFSNLKIVCNPSV